MLINKLSFASYQALAKAIFPLRCVVAQHNSMTLPMTKDMLSVIYGGGG